MKKLLTVVVVSCAVAGLASAQSIPSDQQQIKKTVEAVRAQTSRAEYGTRAAEAENQIRVKFWREEMPKTQVVNWQCRNTDYLWRSTVSGRKQDRIKCYDPKATTSTGGYFYLDVGQVKNLPEKIYVDDIITFSGRITAANYQSGNSVMNYSADVAVTSLKVN